MSVVIINVNEFLQFGCWTPDPTAMPEELTCEGLGGFFSAINITDVQIITGSQFLFDPQLIFPLSDGGTTFADPGLFPNPEHFATLLLDPSKGLTFTGSGMAPMLLVRDVFINGSFKPPNPGEPTQFSYQASSGDTVIVQHTDSGTIPTLEVATFSDLGE
jgi:hypothetical protein